MKGMMLNVTCCWITETTEAPLCILEEMESFFNLKRDEIGGSHLLPGCRIRQGIGHSGKEAHTTLW